MDRLKKLTQYMIFSYENFSNSRFDNQELKLQKLMYFAQRESFALTGEPLFDNEFEGWIHGPVLPELRFYFDENYRPAKNSDFILNERDKFIINSTIAKYGQYDAWYLRNLSHDEISWKNSRIGLSDTEPGQKIILKDDIRLDAEKVRIYDYQYDSYLDEFEEFDEEVMTHE